MSTPKFVVGSKQWLKVEVTSDDPLLDTDTVEIKVGGTWRPATWIGDPATKRRARTLVDFTDLTPGSHEVYARVTDSDEEAVLDAGSIRVEAEKAS